MLYLPTMSAFVSPTAILFGFLAVSGLLLIAYTKAQDLDAETTDSSFFSNPLLNFNKLKESLSAVNWNEYFDLVKENGSEIRGIDTNASDNDYLVPEGPKVQFILFTDKTTFHNFKVGSHEDFEKSGFRFDYPTKIITHGFLSSTKADVVQLNKNAYFETGNYNIIGMDWSVLCEFEYFTAMRGAQIAGVELANFIDWLANETVPVSSLHIIGHSLGSHVAAMGAARIKEGKVGRITGLDPAGPGYNKDDVLPVYRLDPSDAILVDVIHTNMKFLSAAATQGHLDFFPNGGRFQPGCPNMYDIWTVGSSMQCNHGRAYEYFAETIRNKNAFKAYRCPSFDFANFEICTIDSGVYMGQEETYASPGVYYMKTREAPPYSYT